MLILCGACNIFSSEKQNFQQMIGPVTYWALAQSSLTTPTSSELILKLDSVTDTVKQNENVEKR